MYINKISLTNFRSYSALNLEFTKGINIIIGKNGVGKTNILEALTLLSNTKSFRVSEDAKMIKHLKEVAKVETIFNNHHFLIVINQDNKFCYIDKNQIKSKDFIGRINCVLFEPNDITLFKDSPKKRRRLLDMELSKISKEYLSDSYVYYKILKEKNNLLKKAKIDKILLETLNDSLIEPMYRIIKKRNEFITFINERINDYYHKLTNQNHKIKIKYECCINEISKLEIKNKLIKTIEKDLMYKSAYLGIHKEDIKFIFENQEISELASQGQRRMVMIAFKMSLIAYISEILKEKPILLLDDILSELDEFNQSRLFKTIEDDVQTIITSTDIKNVKIDRKYRLIEIK